MKNLIFFLILLFSLNCFSKIVKGYVYDSNTKQALEAVTLLTGDKVQGATDKKGFFEIEVADETSKLSTSYIGYESSSVNLTAAEVSIYIKPAEIIDKSEVPISSETQDYFYQKAIKNTYDNFTTKGVFSVNSRQYQKVDNIIRKFGSADFKVHINKASLENPEMVWERGQSINIVDDSRNVFYPHFLIMHDFSMYLLHQSQVYSGDSYKIYKKEDSKNIYITTNKGGKITIDKKFYKVIEALAIADSTEFEILGMDKIYWNQYFKNTYSDDFSYLKHSKYVRKYNYNEKIDSVNKVVHLVEEVIENQLYDYNLTQNLTNAENITKPACDLYDFPNNYKTDFWSNPKIIPLSKEDKKSFEELLKKCKK